MSSWREFRRVFTDEERERILTFLRENDAASLADLIESGRFTPDADKWTAWLQRIESKRRQHDESLREAEQRTAAVSTVGRQNPEVERLPKWLEVGARFADVTSASIIAVRTHTNDIQKLLSAKWGDIGSAKRSFGLAPDQPYTVRVESEKLRAFALDSFVFRQAAGEAPSMSVDVRSSDAGWPCRLDSHGALNPTRRYPVPVAPEYLLLLNLGVVLHLADLVIPARAITSAKQRSHPSGERVTPSQETKRHIREIPRTSRTQRNDSGTTEPTGNRSPYSVDPFRRRLPVGYTPTFAKIVEADQYGINLQGPGYPSVQYTFVREHVRGGVPSDVAPSYSQGYRAVKTLDTILTMFGL